MDAGDYKAGMATFKADTLANIDHYLQLQKEARLYVKLFLLGLGARWQTLSAVKTLPFLG